MTDLISFDLDGTLLDTAKDFHFAINKLKSHYGLPPSEYEDIKSRVSEGALNLIRFAFESQAKETERSKSSSAGKRRRACSFARSLVLMGLEGTIPGGNNPLNSIPRPALCTETRTSLAR